jgi:hypothetical protein
MSTQRTPQNYQSVKISFRISSLLFILSYLYRLIAPSHSLIQAFLLQKENFCDIKNIIVESDTDALKLKNTLDALTSLKK